MISRRILAQPGTYQPRSKSLEFVSYLSLAVLLLGGVSLCFAADETAADPNSTNSSLYVKVQLSNSLKLSKLKAGDVIRGNLARDVYSSDRKRFAAGSPVDLLVDHMEKRLRTRDDHWPWVVKAFTPRHEKYPAFRTATVSGERGESALQVSLISVSRRREVHAQTKKKEPGQHAGNEADSVEIARSGEGSTKPPAATMVLEAFDVEGVESSSMSVDTSPSVSNWSGLEILPAGTSCKILLLGDVSASKSKAGDAVQARLLEPVLLNSRVVLPAGSLFEGKVVKKIPPRWGSRAGSLYLTFTGLTLPGGNLIPITASLIGAELDRRSHTKIDAEGQLRGERPGKAWMAINIGVTAGLAKEADDTLQLVIEAVLSTATDASTAGVGRITATCISGIFMVTRRGRDVVLPRFTELDIALDRPLSMTRIAKSKGEPVSSNGN